MYNKVILIGRLGNDPELRTDLSSPLCRLSLATNESYRTKEGKKVNKTTWHKVILWGKKAEIAGKYLKKGDVAGIEGKISVRSYKDKEGVSKTLTEIEADRIQLFGNNRSKENQEDLEIEQGPSIVDLMTEIATIYPKISN